MWTPKTSNKSNSNRVDVNGRTYMTPYSTPFVPSSAASNESGGLRNNIQGSFTPYFPGSYASRSSTNIVGLPSGIQQTRGGSSSMRNTSNVLTNEPFQRYHHFQQPQPQPQPQPCLYNPSRGKEVAQRDDYGLLGLLKIIKGANPAKTSLAMGVDPHSLGLDLNSLEPLNQNFASPWSDEPVKEGPKYNIPDCYNTEQPPPLKFSHFKKFHLAMLFYIFYSMPQDQAQLFAANELHDRGWYFHRELHMWFSRDKNSVPTVKNETYEVGCYIFFDPSTWQTIRQENVVLYYKMIEQRPTIPL